MQTWIETDEDFVTFGVRLEAGDASVPVGGTISVPFTAPEGANVSDYDRKFILNYVDTYPFVGPGGTGARVEWTYAGGAFTLTNRTDQNWSIGATLLFSLVVATPATGGGSGGGGADTRFPIMYARNVPGAPPPDGPFIVRNFSLTGPYFATYVQLDDTSALATAADYVAAINAATIRHLGSDEPLPGDAPRNLVAELDPGGPGGWRMRSTNAYGRLTLPEEVSPPTAAHAGFTFGHSTEGYDGFEIATLRFQFSNARQDIQNLEGIVQQQEERIQALEDAAAQPRTFTTSSNESL